MPTARRSAGGAWPELHSGRMVLPPTCSRSLKPTNLFGGSPHIGNSAGALRRIGVQVNLAFAPTMRLTMLNRSKVLRASRSMRVTITTSSGGTSESSPPNSTKTDGHGDNHIGFAATNQLGT